MPDVLPAPSDCPFEIVDAQAWINFMPGSSPSPRRLMVSVRLSDATATAILLKADAATTGSLILEVRLAATAPIPGRLAWRETISNQIYQRVIFRCAGGDIHVIEEIEQVR